MMDRCDYVSGFHTELAYLLAAEELAELEVTPKAQYLRVLFSELCRLTSHHTWLAACGLDTGALTPFLYAFIDREKIADVYEAVTGSRMMFNYFRPGGVKADLPAGIDKTIREILVNVDKSVDEYEALLTNNEIFRNRSRGVGPIPPSLIQAWGVTGPMMRASGLDFDLRRDEPYGAYGDFDVHVPLGEAGDSFDRYAVRIAEMREAARFALAGARRHARGRLREPGRAARLQAAGGRCVPAGRKPARRARRAAGERRDGQPVAAQGPLPRLLEPARRRHRARRGPHG